MSSTGKPVYNVGSAPAGVAPPDPPPAPEFDRRIKFHRTQIMGLLLVGILPVLALFGLFGVYGATTTAASETLEVTVDYPTSQRLKVRQPLRIALTNLGDSTLPSVEVAVSASYIHAFSDVASTPSPDSIDDEAYNFVLADIAPGETRRIATEMQAQRYWRHEGTVAWTALDPEGTPVDGGSIAFATMVWP